MRVPERESAQISEFWKWFTSIASSLAADVQNGTLLQEFDSKLAHLNSKLSWEIGPGSSEPWQLVISPNLDPDLRETAKDIVAHAPVVEGWEFYSARRPKKWDYGFRIDRAENEAEPIELDATGWSFVLLEYPDGGREVLLQADNLPKLDADERWQAAAIVLESILGEEVLMDGINEFELVEQLEPRFAQRRRPIQGLRAAVLGA